MQTTLNQVSFVVLARNHNPTLINPDFLERTNIVQPKWGWKPVGDRITTPPFAKVQYDSEVQISVELEKLQITDASKSVETHSKAGEIATNYIKVLEHINYHSLGINFQCLVTNGFDENYLKEKFLKTGPWDNEDSPIKSVGLNLVYPIPSGRVRVTMDSGTLLDDKGVTTKIIMVAANFHREFQGDNINEQIVSAISKYSADLDLFNKLISDLGF